MAPDPRFAWHFQLEKADVFRLGEFIRFPMLINIIARPNKTNRLNTTLIRIDSTLEAGNSALPLIGNYAAVIRIAVFANRVRCIK